MPVEKAETPFPTGAARSFIGTLGKASIAVLGRMLPGEHIGDQSRRFMEGLGWVGFFSFLARGLSFLVQLLAGRWLGPEEFGTANLIQATAMILVIAIQLGFPAALGILPGKVEDVDKRRGLVGSLFSLGGLWGLFAFLALALPAVSEPLARLLHVSAPVYLWSVVYALLTSLLTLSVAALQGLQRFSQAGKVLGAYGIALLVSFFVLWLRFGAVFPTFVLAMEAGILTGFFLALYNLGWGVISDWSSPQLPSLGTYLAVPLLQTVIEYLLLAVVPLVLSVSLGSWGVGVFSAYCLGSIGVAQVLGLGIVNVVLVPLSSGPGRFAGAWRRFRSIMGRLVVFGFAGFFVFTVVALRLAGGRYPLHVKWVLLFSAAASLGFVYWVARGLLFSHSSKGLRLGVAATAAEAIVSVAVLVRFVPAFGIAAAGGALVAGYLAGLAWSFYWGERLQAS